MPRASVSRVLRDVHSSRSVPPAVLLRTLAFQLAFEAIQYILHSLKCNISCPTFPSSRQVLSPCRLPTLWASKIAYPFLLRLAFHGCRWAVTAAGRCQTDRTSNASPYGMLSRSTSRKHTAIVSGFSTAMSRSSRSLYPPGNVRRPDSGSNYRSAAYASE